MNIRKVAEKTGLSAYTIRFYEEQGLLPRVARTNAGVRQFTESDVQYLQFLVSLKKTGMSLEEIGEFTIDGCILERLREGKMPPGPVENRLAILRRHQERLTEQQRELERLVIAVQEKIGFYEQYLKAKR